MAVKKIIKLALSIGSNLNKLFFCVILLFFFFKERKNLFIRTAIMVGIGFKSQPTGGAFVWYY